MKFFMIQIACFGSLLGMAQSVPIVYRGGDVTPRSLNENFRSNALPVGTIVPSILSPVQFARQVGDDGSFDPTKSLWLPCDGRSVSGSRYATVTGTSTLPDLRSVFIRGLNEFEAGKTRNDRYSDPDGSRVPGSVQYQSFEEHEHIYHAGRTPYTEQGTGGVTYLISPGDKKTSKAGGKETRPNNVALFYFIKVN